MSANIVIDDDDLMDRAMRVSGCKTRRETVEMALLLLASVKCQEKPSGKGSALGRLSRFRGCLPKNSDKELFKDRDEWDR